MLFLWISFQSCAKFRQHFHSTQSCSAHKGAEENAKFRLLRLHNVMPSLAAAACLSDLWNSTIGNQITDRNTTLLKVLQKSVWNAANKSQAEALTCSQWKMCRNKTGDNSQNKREIGQTLRKPPTNEFTAQKKKHLLKKFCYREVFLCLFTQFRHRRILAFICKLAPSPEGNILAAKC